jgi:hypothetical protein
VRVFRTVTDYRFPRPEVSPGEAWLAEHAAIVHNGVRHAPTTGRGFGFPPGTTITPKHHGIRQLESGVWRCATDWTVEGPIREEALRKLATEKASLLHHSIWREFPQAVIEMDHKGLRLLSEDPPAAPEPSRTSSP